MTLMLMMKVTGHPRRTTLQLWEGCQEVHEDKEAHLARQVLQVHPDYQEQMPSKVNLAAQAPEAQGHLNHWGHPVPQDLQLLRTPQLDPQQNQD